jgi:hypothetical protein
MRETKIDQAIKALEDEIRIRQQAVDILKRTRQAIDKPTVVRKPKANAASVATA